MRTAAMSADKTQNFPALVLHQQFEIRMLQHLQAADCGFFFRVARKYMMYLKVLLPAKHPAAIRWARMMYLKVLLLAKNPAAIRWQNLRLSELHAAS